MAHNQTKKVILNGLPVDKKQASIPAVGSAVYYGTGCFETMKSESGKIFRFQDHIQRLNDGLKYLGTSENKLLTLSDLKSDIENLLTVNGLEKDVVKIRYQVSLIERNGYRGSSDSETIRLAAADKISSLPTERSLSIVKTRVIPSECKPAKYKSSNMLHYRNAYREALNSGADDGIMLTIDGFVSETSISNIFWKKDNVVFTPSVECDILPGIMRNTVIETLINDYQYKVSEGVFKPAELFQADIVWITNSVMEIVPVKSIDGKVLATDKDFFQYLINLLSETKQRYFENE